MATAPALNSRSHLSAAIALANGRAERLGIHEYAPIAGHYVASETGALHYVAAGQGPLLVFVHGFPSFWYCWERQIQALRRRYRVVALDAPGAGGSDKPVDDAAYALPRLVQALDAVARAEAGEERFVLIGHDWGAALAFAFAQARPERLHGVVGLSAPPFNQFLALVATDPEQQRRSAYMESFRALSRERIVADGLASRLATDAYAGLAERGLIDADELALFRETVGDPSAMWGGTAWYRANLLRFCDIGPEHRWPANDAPLTIPSLLVWGEADSTFVDRVPTDFAFANPGAEVRRLPGVGHWPMLEAPDTVTTAIAALAARSIA